MSKSKQQKWVFIYNMYSNLLKKLGFVEGKLLFNKDVSKYDEYNKRQFRCDFFLELTGSFCRGIIIEFNGGQWVAGRHNHAGKGYENDLCKSNLAQFRGYKYFQFTYEMLERGEMTHLLTEMGIIEDVGIKNKRTSPQS